MRASVRYSTTVPFGTLAAYGLAALCSAMGCWRAVFAAAGLFLTATALCWLRGMRVLAPPLPAAPARSAARAAARPPAPSSSGRAGAHLPCGSGKRNDPRRHPDLTPTYLHDIYGLDTPSPSCSLSRFPCEPVRRIHGQMGKRPYISQRSRHGRSGVLAACALLAAPAVGVRLPLWARLALLGLCAALMLAVNTMFVTLVPLRLQSTGRISALSGLLNPATYAGSTLSGYGMGRCWSVSGHLRRCWASAQGAGSLFCVRPRHVDGNACADKPVSFAGEGLLFSSTTKKFKRGTNQIAKERHYSIPSKRQRSKRKVRKKLAAAKPCIFAQQSAGHAANAQRGWRPCPQARIGAVRSLPWG